MIEMIERIGWNEALHPRSGGRFAPKGTATQGKSATQGGRARGGHAHDSSEKLSYNGRTGAGYGKKGGDGRVHGLQSELNRLGFKDSSGKPLKLDGKLGPRTTAAIKHAQKALGLKVDGIATPGLLAKLKGSKKTTARKAHAPRKSVPVGMSKPRPAKTAKAAPVRKRPTFVKQANPPPTARKAGPMSKNVSRSFNPSQDRDRDGQWSDGIPGPGADALKLAGRIKLGPGEKFGGSAKVGDGYGDATAVIARVDTAAGPVIRFGVVAPQDAGKWQGVQRGRTVELDAAGAAQLREVLTRAKADGKRSVTEHRSLPGSDVEADIASGVISGSRWGDVGWNLTREEGQDGRGEWNLALDPAVGPGLRDNFNITKNAVADKLGKALSDLLDTSASMASMTRHLPGRHNQQAHANRIGRPTNTPGKTGLAKIAGKLKDDPDQGPALPPKNRKLSNTDVRNALVGEDAPFHASASRKTEDHRARLMDAGASREHADAILKDLGAHPDRDYETFDAGYVTHHRVEAEKKSAAEQALKAALANATPAAYDRLIGKDGAPGLVKSKPVIKVFESMRDHGWTITNANGHGSYTFQSPDESKTIQVLAINSVKIYDERHNSISGVKALTYIQGGP